jgi:phage regulator Rha-like protein/predicted Fe-Mo cluster-binding NifX family protein
MINLVQIVENEPRVSHRVIAENTEVQAKNVFELIEKHMESLKLFGKAPFQTEAIINAKNKVNEKKTYYLNEQQATLLITFMRNTQKVIEFKIALVKAFFEIKDQLQNKALVPIELPYQDKVNLSSAKWREAFYRAYDGCCFYTGQSLSQDNFHLDHIIPKAHGGKDVLNNLVLCSPKVNQSKSSSYNDDFIARTQEVVISQYAPKVLEIYQIIPDQYKAEYKVGANTNHLVIRNQDNNVIVNQFDELGVNTLNAKVEKATNEYIQSLIQSLSKHHEKLNDCDVVYIEGIDAKHIDFFPDNVEFI